MIDFVVLGIVALVDLTLIAVWLGATERRRNRSEDRQRQYTYDLHVARTATRR